MQLWLVRHAIAEEPEFAASDFERKLTSKGRKQFRRLADCLAAQGVTPQAILTSPLVRAVETAEILAEAAGMSGAACRRDQRLGPGVTVESVAMLADQQASDCVALVGHEPDMSELVTVLTGGVVQFSKGAIACIEFAGRVGAGEGCLRWFLVPKLLKD